jgi:AcrR family transcriptional regulator
MTAVETVTQKKFKYHHGELRVALIEAALELLKTGGIEAVNLRALAKATGVTQAAPYSHFRDKDALLAAVAETGFQRLALQMADDATGYRTSKERVEKLVASYIRFAFANKPLFQLMYSRELSEMKNFPTLAMTAGKSYALISAALSARPGVAPEDTRFLTATIWSLCHGLTTMIIDDKIKPEQFGTGNIEEFVRKTIAPFSSVLV